MYTTNDKATLTTQETQGLGVLVVHQLNTLFQNQDNGTGINCCARCCAPCAFVSELCETGQLKPFIALAPNHLTEEWLSMGEQELHDWLTQQWSGCPNHEELTENSDDDKVDL